MNYPVPEKSKKRWPVILALAVFLAAAVLAVLYFTGVFRLRGSEARVSKLRCVARNGATPWAAGRILTPPAPAWPPGWRTSSTSSTGTAGPPITTI